MSGNISAFGVSGNFWTAAAPTTGTNSASIDIQFCKSVTIMGLESAANPTLSVWASSDGTNWYNTSDTVFVTGGSNFYTVLTNNFNARYIRLQTNTDCTSITAVCVAKL